MYDVDGGDSWSPPINLDDTLGLSRSGGAMDETGNWEATAAYTQKGAIFAYAPATLYEPWSE